MAPIPTVEPDPDTVVERFDDEAVVVSLRTEQYHALDPLATAYWGAIVEHRDPTAVIDALVAELGTERRTVEVELRAFIAGLLERELVRAVE